MLNNKQQIILFGLVGLLASVGVGYGEYLLHYTPNGIGYDGTEFNFFKYIPLSRLTLGHFISIGFVPFYIMGYYHFYLIFKKQNPIFAVAIQTLGVIAFTLGGMWISSRAQLGYLIHQIADHPEDDSLHMLVQSYRDHGEILVKSLRIWIAAISILFVVPILRGKTPYPKWMAMTNPLLLLIVVKLTYEYFPTIGNIIGPIAMNVVHFVLFGCSLLIIYNNEKIKT